MIMSNEAAPSYDLPPIGDSPSTRRQGTTPGSFAQKGRVGTPWTFSSPDTPGMPAPSDKTAWDFLPQGWTIERAPDHESGCLGHNAQCFENQPIRAVPLQFQDPKSKIHNPITQLEHARLGILNATRIAIIENATVPIGTVPIYSMIIGKKIEDLDWPLIEAELINQCDQGVDYMTIHAGVRKAHLPFVKNRLIGIVSRGG